MAMKLEDKLIEALARAMTAEKIAEKAFAMAEEALVELRAMKQSTHKVELIDPYKGVFGEEEEKPKIEEPPIEEPKLQKLSPFNITPPNSLRRDSESDKLPSKILEAEQEERDELWEMSVGEGSV